MCRLLLSLSHSRLRPRHEATRHAAERSGCDERNQAGLAMFRLAHSVIIASHVRVPHALLATWRVKRVTCASRIQWGTSIVGKVSTMQRTRGMLGCVALNNRKLACLVACN